MPLNVEIEVLDMWFVSPFPGLTVNWYRSMIPVFQSRHAHVAADGRLCYTSFMEFDAGTYVCYVTNIINSAGGSSVVKFSDSFDVTAAEGGSILIIIIIIINLIKHWFVEKKNIHCAKLPRKK